MKIKNTEFVVFDVETTGLSAQDGDRIVEIAAMKVKDGKVIDKFYSLVNPNRSIPSEATRVNNITDDMVVKEPLAAENKLVLCSRVRLVSTMTSGGKR